MKNLIFLTMVDIQNVSNRGIYTDLLRKFRDEGYKVYVVTPRERRTGLKTTLEEKDGVHFLGVRTLNLQKTNLLEKGIGQVLIENQYKRAIVKYLKDVSFNLILYSTPPITFPKVIAYLKRQNPGALTYLLLKDIFPQNAVDIGLISKTGVSSILYKYFRKKEKKMYSVSDYIGCMSPANVEYILKNNPEVDANRVEVAPNSIELRHSVSNETTNKETNRIKYGLPLDRPVFIYGGNLGRPQGVSFLLECLRANSSRSDCFFLIIGSGTELSKLKAWYNEEKPHSARVMESLPKEEYDVLVQSCDVGLVFLDHRFTIPNFPSRLLSYLENKMPVLCATDLNTDMGRIVQENGIGFWCESSSIESFTSILEKMIHADRKAMGEAGYEFLCKNYLIDNTYNAIVAHV